jgi:hypothetical protein
MRVLFISCVAACALSTAVSSGFAQTWNDRGPGRPEALAGPIRPAAFRSVTVDADALQRHLLAAPHEDFVAPANSPTVLTLPRPDGTLATFRFVESPVMAPELQAQFPNIRTFLGQGVDDRTALLRCDMTPAGFHAMVLSAGETWYIDPAQPGDRSQYIAYTKSDFYATTDKRRAECSPLAGPSSALPESEGRRVRFMGRPATPDPALREGPAVAAMTGNTLRTFSLALACTGEYAAYHGGTTAGALAAMNTSMARINGVFERDFAIRMVLVPNNTSLIFLTASTDPYTNNDGGAMLGQNQTTCDNVIGSANYDIGHVFSTGGGGVAYLQAPCTSFKAGGVTGSGAPVGDPFDIDYVAHEMGHQFGANHTQNNSCNRASSAAYEPGSASTIMGYAGICAPNLQPNSDDHFHVHSYIEIVNYAVNGAGSSCATLTSTGNTAPTVDAGINGRYIPKSTPFELTATASDANGDILTYNWEEYDLGPVTASGDNTLTNPSGTQPIFRSWPSVTSATRTFPRPLNLVANTTVIGEHMPTYSRELNFRCTVRDNRAGGGGVAHDLVTMQVAGGAGPFVITAPNGGGTFTGNTPVTVTWNVASTNLSPVNCTTVNIYLSTDGGYTWPHTLATNAANSGTATVTFPNLTSSSARIKVKAAANYFFDISNANFSIVPGGTPGCTTSTACNYNPAATVDNGTCIYATGCDTCSGGAVADGDTDNDGVCNTNEIPGCSNPSACNYLATATDPATCILPAACEFCLPGGGFGTFDLSGNGLVEVADILLLLGDFGCLGADCTADLDGDGATAVSDVLLLLGAFGEGCE